MDVRRRRARRWRVRADADLRSVAPGRARSLFACAVRAAGGHLGSGFAGRADFERCFDLPEPDKRAKPQFDLRRRLRLDPKLTNERAQIIRLQQKLVDFAEAVRSFIVLLDVPPGLNQRQILNWRVNFNSSFAAAYHPWLSDLAARRQPRRADPRRRLQPSPPGSSRARR